MWKSFEIGLFLHEILNNPFPSFFFVGNGLLSSQSKALHFTHYNFIFGFQVKDTGIKSIILFTEFQFFSLVCLFGFILFIFFQIQFYQKKEPARPELWYPFSVEFPIKMTRLVTQLFVFCAYVFDGFQGIPHYCRLSGAKY